MQSPYQNYISIDVETGGLPNTTKKAVYDFALTEVAFVAINKDLEIVEKQSWLIRPYKEDLIYDKRAEEASGISRAMVEEQGMDLNVAVKEMIAFLKRYKVGSSLPTVFGHNFIKFDADFMINAFEFCKENFLKYVKEEPEDTIKWARLCWPESDNYKNGTCCRNAGVVLTDAHRALSDAIATAQLWIWFMKNLRGTGSNTMAVSAGDIPAIRRFREGFEL